MNKLTVAPVFQSYMVLQRDKPVVVWGSAPKSAHVTVTLRGSENTAIAENGMWKCILPPQKAGKGYQLVILCDYPDTEPIYLEQISIGDVWLACGQSNMEFFLRYDAEWEKIKNYEYNPDIHMYNVPQLAFRGHIKNTDGYGFWFQEKEPGFEKFSAPGYSFARHIQPAIGVPVGIIGCNWGGSSASAWLDEEYLNNAPLSVYLKEYTEAVKAFTPEELKKRSLDAWAFEDSPEHAAEFMPLLYGQDEEWQKKYVKKHKNDPIIPMGPFNINRPGGLYHQMLEPLTDFPVKGVLWYQGESDAMHADIYDTLFRALIFCWRKKWNDELPFLFVQLAPFEKWLECDASNYPEVRYKQELVSKTVKNTAMASIMDIGCRYDIHPKQKQEVGRRLALLARGKVYGEDILCESPEFIKGERIGTQISLYFSHCQVLRCVDKFPGNPSCINPVCNCYVHGFMLKQNNNKIAIDSIHVEDNKVILEADTLLKGLCTVYFAWENYTEVNVFNENGLPVKPFMWEG